MVSTSKEVKNSIQRQSTWQSCIRNTPIQRQNTWYSCIKLMIFFGRSSQSKSYKNQHFLKQALRFIQLSFHALFGTKLNAEWAPACVFTPRSHPFQTNSIKSILLRFDLARLNSSLQPYRRNHLCVNCFKKNKTGLWTETDTKGSKMHERKNNSEDKLSRVSSQNDIPAFFIHFDNLPSGC